MVDLSYESFKQGKLKTSKPSTDLSYYTFLKDKEVQSQKNVRIEQGLPVSVIKDRVEPTAVGGMVRSIIRPVLDVATNVVQAGQTLTKKGAQEAPLSSNYMGKVTGLGTVDITKGPWEKENLKTIIKSASTGAEIASYLNAAGVGKKTIAGLTKQGVLANKATFAEWAVKNIPQLAKEGALQGIAYTVGSQGREYADTGKPFSATQAVSDIALSTAGNVIIPSALQKIFGAKTSKIMAARAGERAIKDADILSKPIPGATKELIENIASTEIPLTRAEKIQKVVDGETTTTPVKEVSKEVPSTETSKVIKETSEESLVKDYESIANDMPDVVAKDDFDYGTFKEWSDTVRNLDIDEAINVAMGGKKNIPNNVPEGAYLSIMKNIADETNDIQLAKKLAESNVVSKGAQTTVAAKMAKKGNVSDALRDIKTTLMKKKGIAPEKFIKEEATLIKNIQKKFKEVTDEVISSLICK